MLNLTDLTGFAGRAEPNDLPPAQALVFNFESGVISENAYPRGSIVSENFTGTPSLSSSRVNTGLQSLLVDTLERAQWDLTKSGKVQDFTVEAFINTELTINAQQADFGVFVDEHILLHRWSFTSGVMRRGYSTESPSTLEDASGVIQTAATYLHVAVTYLSSTDTFYLHQNGTMVKLFAYDGTATPSGVLSFHAQAGTLLGGSANKHHLDDLRFWYGKAIYGAGNFTPPAPPYF